MIYDPRWTLNGLALTEYPFGVMHNSADPGAAETVSSILASMIADGDVELTQRRGNRTYQLTVMIEGLDRAMIANAQADLVRAVEQPLGTLEFDPGEGEVTVFETFAGTAELANGTDDDASEAGFQRVILTIPCRPFVRPQNEVTIQAPALPPSGSTPPADVTIDGGTSTSAYRATGPSWSTSITLGVNTAPFTGSVYGTIANTSGAVHTIAGDLTYTASIAADSARPYVVVTGRQRLRASRSAGSWGGWAYGNQVKFSDASGNSLLVVDMRNTDATGGWRATIYNPDILNQIKVTVSRPNEPYGYSQLQIGVDSIIRSAGSVSGTFTGKAQSRQVPIYGSQRTELSLAILGLDTSDSPVPLGEQVLIHTASAGSDNRAKFLGCRAQSGLGGTADSDAVTGVKSTLGTTSSPTGFMFSATTLLPGEFYVYARLKGTAGSAMISYAASLDGAGPLDASDPVGGWYARVVPITSGYRIVPLGVLILPPALIEDPGATVTVNVASSTPVDLDEVWVAHVESGQVTLLDTNDPIISAVRLDAATVGSVVPSAWVGIATPTGPGVVIAAGPRIQAFDQHMAEPGLLQISTVTPGCASSRVSARYYPRYAHDVAPLPMDAA